jgi:hypothetical protein
MQFYTRPHKFDMMIISYVKFFIITDNLNIRNVATIVGMGLAARSRYAVDRKLKVPYQHWLE